MAKILLVNILELVDFFLYERTLKTYLTFYNLARGNFESCLKLKKCLIIINSSFNQLVDCILIGYAARGLSVTVIE